MRNLFILRGAPASGKSTWIKENNLESYTLSSDSIRLMYQSPVTNIDGTRCISQNNDKHVWELLMKLLEQRMEKGEFVVIDATHYKSTLVNRYTDLVDKYRYRVNVVDFSKVPEEELLKRNAARDEYKRVPEDVISKMVVALKDDTEVKKSYKVLTPEEASQMLKEPLSPINLDELGYEKVVCFGDIHGCYEPLKKYFEENPFNEKTCYIFCGDYIDRGLQNKEVLEFLISIYNKKNVVLLEGNHEKWLRMYSDKDYNIKNYEKVNEYHDICIRKVLAQLDHKKIILDKQIKKNKQEIETLSKMLLEERQTNADAETVFYQFEEVDVRGRNIELTKENSMLQNQVTIVKDFITCLKHERINTGNTLSSIQGWYEAAFGEDLSFDITRLLTETYSVTENKKDNPIKSLEFLKRTVPQIENIDKADLRQLCRKFAQLSYFEFKGQKYLVTHAGVPCMPDIFTPTEEIIKGVGKYEEHELIDRTFCEKYNDIVTIHGHRNTMKNAIINGNVHNRFINLCAEIEYGEPLRILEIDNLTEVGLLFENTVFTPKEEQITSDDGKSSLERLKDMVKSKWINTRNLDKDVMSINFNHDAFDKGHWNLHTCTARGLFVNKKNGDIVARSYSKFFNHNEVDETKSPALKQTFQYPVIGYKKENGFLGLVSKYKGELYFFTKSSDGGDYVNWFIGQLCDNYGIYFDWSKFDTIWEDGKHYSAIYNRMIEYKNSSCFNSQQESIILEQDLQQMKQTLMDEMSPNIEEGFTYIFECIDPVNDPHIIKYDKGKVTLLDVVENTIEEENFKPYDKLCFCAKCLGVPVKEKELEFNSWEAFEDWKTKFSEGITSWDCKHEGYVFVDQNLFRVKFKSRFYKFWKQMRGLKDILARGAVNKKVYKTKEEIQIVKLMRSIPQEELKEMSIIDIEDKFYENYEG